MAHFTKNSDKCNQYLKKSGEIDPRWLCPSNLLKMYTSYPTRFWPKLAEIDRSSFFPVFCEFPKWIG